MGCVSQKTVKKKMIEQDNKINELKKINEAIQNNFNKFHENQFNVIMKQTTETAHDISNLKQIFEDKLNNLEKTVEKINLDFKSVSDGFSRDTNNFKNSKNNEINKKNIEIPENNNNNTLSLNYEEEKNDNNNINKENSKIKKDDLATSDIKIDMYFNEENEKILNDNNINNNSKNLDKEKNNLKNILEDEEIQKIYNGVKSKMFKKAPQHK